MSQQNTTNRVFEFIENKYFTQKKNLIEEVSRILNLQVPSVYKKAKGESSLSLEETVILCRHYRLSLDEVFGLNDDKIYFDFPALYGTVKNELEFLEPIRQDLEVLYRLNPVIYYATKELPLFYYFISPRLTAFKFHVFKNFVWNPYPSTRKFKYSDFEFNEEFQSMVKKVFQLYSSMNSIEIWNTAILDNTYNQLKYYLEAGLFENVNEVLDISNDILYFIEKLAEIIYSNSKEPLNPGMKYFGSFQLYNNEIAHTNNVVFVKSDSNEAVYCTYDNPNFMRSISPLLCEYTFQWMNKLIHNSMPITGGSNKDQNAFINRLKEKHTKNNNYLKSIIENQEK